MFKNDKTFSKEIFNKLNAVSAKLVDNVLKDIFTKIEANADDPMLWPLQIGEEIKPIIDCDRAINIMVDRLDDNGFICIQGTDYYVVDVLIEETDDDCDLQSAQVLIGAPTALELSRNKEANKLNEVFNYVFSKIENEATNGEFKMLISINGHPVNGNSRIIKKLIKKLHAKGYFVGDTLGKAIDISGRPDYTKIKKLIISWAK